MGARGAAVVRTIVHFDGGGRNGGPLACAAIITQEGRAVAREARLLDRGTTNTAEYEGLLLGLRLARSLAVEELVVYGDSRLVVMQVRGEWAVKNRILGELRARARAELRRFDMWRLLWTPREKNAAADALCRQALGGEKP